MDELLDKTSFQMLNPVQLGEITKMRNERDGILKSIGISD